MMVRPERVGRVANVILIVVGQSTQGLGFGAIALFVSLIRSDLHITFAEAGAFAAVTTFTYAAMQIPAGFLGDRFDAKRVFAVGLIGVNVTSLLFALLHNYPIMLVDLGISGVFRALMFGPGLILMINQFRKDQRATAMGIFIAGGISSNIVLNVLAPLLVGPLGWRGLLAVFSASALVITVAFIVLGSPARTIAVTDRPRIRDLPTLVSHPIVWLTGIIQFARLGIVSGLAFWLPSILIGDKGFSLATAGLIVAVSSLVIAPSNILGGILADRFQRPLLIIGLSFIFIALTTFLLTLSQGIAVVVVVVVIDSVFLQLYFGPLFALPLKFLADRNSSLLSGVGNFCANLGGLCSTFAMGYLKDATGSFAIGLIGLAGMAVLGLAVTIVIRFALKPVQEGELGSEVGPARAISTA